MASRARPRSPSGARDIDEQTQVGEVYMRSLLRSQLRHAGVVLGFVAVALASLPLLFSVLPQLGRVRLWFVPLPWLVVGVLVYPVLYAAAWWYVRAAERTERDFAEIIEHRATEHRGTQGRT